MPTAAALTVAPRLPCEAPRMTRIAAALIDLDGTLVDSNEFHVLSWREAFREHGHDFRAEVIRRQIGKGADQLIPSLLPGVSAEEGEGKHIATLHGEFFKRRYMPQVEPLAGAAELVRGLHAVGVKVVLASSASGEEVDHYVNLLRIDDAVTARTSSDDVERTKPAGDVFAAALGKVAPVAASAAIVVGDTPYDALAACKCGIATLAVLSGGFDEQRLIEAGAMAVYNDASAVLAALREADYDLTSLRRAAARVPG
jgi:phosphoglycolate phosphatase-like HAD superfamily hydrolase